MPAALVHNAYGKSHVRLTKVQRRPDRHDLLIEYDDEERVLARNALVEPAVIENEREVSAAFVEDAARGLDEARTLACTDAWRAAGVRFATAGEVLGTL